MRYLLKTVILFIVSSMLLGGVHQNAKMYPKELSKKRNIIDESSLINPTKTGNSQSVNYSSSRSGTFNAVLVDSSKNGYGLYSGTTNPITYIPGTGIAISYRQWQGVAASSGYIGAAESADGVNWTISSTINNVYPGSTTPDAANGEPAGRYPNMVASANSYPTAVWNEYTNSSGGGENGGRAMYTWDYFGWLGGVYFSPIYDLNSGCAQLPCTPPDLWVGQAQVVDDATGPVLISLWGEGLGPSKFHLIRSGAYISGYFMMNAPVEVFDETVGFYGTEETNYTGTPEFYINDDGIGYLVAVGYWEGYDTGGPIENHTFFYKKTTDYGLTWENTGGVDNTGFNVIGDDVFNSIMYDAGLLGDSLWSIVDDDTVWTELSQAFAAYDYDVKVDVNGGLHIGTVMMSTYPGAGGVYAEPSAGIFHLYNPTPENETTWTASMIRDQSMSFSADNVGMDGSLSAYQYFGIDLGMSVTEGSETFWCITSGVSDTSWVGSDVFLNDIDLYLSVSTDNGATWTDLGNLTNTPSVGGIDYFETTPHMAPFAEDDKCYFIWQMADRTLQTVDVGQDPSLYEDFMQWVYVGSYVDPTVSVDDNMVVPQQFSLEQNYPNPFNPVTTIAYTLEQGADVKLELYNVTGQKIRTLVNSEQSSGEHEFVLNATGLSSGVYFYSLTSNGITQTRKLVLLK